MFYRIEGVLEHVPAGWSTPTFPLLLLLPSFPDPSAHLNLLTLKEWVDLIYQTKPSPNLNLNLEVALEASLPARAL